MQQLAADVAAATAVVGYDLLRDVRDNVSSRPRVMTKIALVGGAAIGDTSVDVYIENYMVGRFTNTHIGNVAPIFPDDFVGTPNLMVPPGAKISAIVAVQGGTNATRIRVQ
jgi:hypothetical protein